MPTSSASPERLHFVTDSPVPGLAVAERRVAEPEATVICVHGGLDRGGSFARLARRSTVFDVVAYDRRGYQASRDLGAAPVEQHVHDLRALVTRERERGPVILFGHSFGGVVTFSAAIASPDDVALVINYESPLPWVLNRPSGRPPLGDDPQFEAEQFFKRVVSRGAWERLSEPERESRRRDGAALVADLSNLSAERPLFQLRDLTTPASYVYGDGALREYYRALAQRLTELNPLVGAIEISHAPHGAHLANPDALSDLIQSRWKDTCASR